MTRSEAIDMLRQISSYLTAGNPVWRTEPIREACEMAIEALTAEPTQTNAPNTLNALDCVDTVSRQAAIDEMSNMYHAAEKWLQEAEDDTIKARAESCMATLVEMKLRVEKLPSAERRGKWIYKSELGWGETWVCSECGEKTTSTVMGKPRWDYCPNCGAKMERRADDE